MQQTRGKQTQRTKIAIIGGGCAAMATAFELSHPRHNGKYDITVYQMGFRLGGKGASGRGSADRIEEHGLHLWMGFYENAFRMMRECYDELKRDRHACDIVDWKDAFVHAPDIGITERTADGRWYPWLVDFPPMPGMPGDPLTESNPFTVREYLIHAAALLIKLLHKAKAHGDPREAGHAVGFGSGWPPMGGPSATFESIERLIRYGQLASMAALIEAMELWRTGIQMLQPSTSRDHGPDDILLRLIDVVATAARKHLDEFVAQNDEIRRIWEIVDLVLAILRGCLRFGLAVDPKGFDAIDDYDWRDWLRYNGASERTLNGAFVRGIYDLMFAYEDGDVQRPRFSASVALRGALRMFFTYRTSLFFRMTAGMGDIVFAPLYEVLRNRGVRFAFFHKLNHIGLAPKVAVPHGSPPWVETLTFEVQARVKKGKEYEPLISVNGLPCWPSKPDMRQLTEAAAHHGQFEAQAATCSGKKKVLHVGQDFDIVVLGVGLGAIPHVAGELIERSSEWKDMVTHLKTVATQAFQIWASCKTTELGWKGGPVNVSGFVEPFDTWADMTHLRSVENWTVPVESIAYFCSVLPNEHSNERTIDSVYAAARHAEVRENAVRFLNHDIGWLWPNAVRRRGQFRWEVLAAENENDLKGEARIGTQYWRANVEPTDRYVLSLPGTTQYRISPLDLHFDNLTVAGDWTASGLNSGCVESAVMSGLLAAHAISGSPTLEDIVGYDHP